MRSREASDGPVSTGPALPLFALLEAPYGMQAAVVSVLPLYVLHAQGVSLERAAAMTAVALSPATLYFLYSPLVDFFVRRRTWYILALLVTVVLSGGAILLPAEGHLSVITAMLFMSMACAMLLSAATGGMMNHLLQPEQKTSVGGWLQAGNTGANALMLAVIVFASTRCSRPELAALVMAVTALPGLAIFAVREPKVTQGQEGFGATVRSMGGELKGLVTWVALPGILLMISPIGNSAITSVLTGLTHDYHASAGQLTFANGWGGGTLCAAGALCTLLAPKRWNRMIPYALAGIIYGSVSLLIGLGPLRPSTLVAGALASNFAVGMAYGAYTGVLLQVMGPGGRCHSSRYTILNSIGNLPTVYMVALLGAVAGHFGPHIMGVVDGGLNIGAAVVFFAWWAWERRRKGAAADAGEMPLAEVA